MKVRFERVSKDRPILRPKVRQHDPEKLARLADSLVDPGQLQPIGLLAKDYSVIFGTGRVLAARMKPQITHLTAAIFEEEVTESAFLRMCFTENQFRQELSNAEKCATAVEYARSDPSMTNKQIAEMLHVDPSLLTRWLSWERCIESVRQALAADKISLTGLYAISQVPAEQQADLLATALAAPNAAAVTSASRRQRNGNGKSGARMTSVKCAMPSGVMVTLKGEGDGLTLSDIIEELASLLKEAKKAEEQGLDSRTWAAVLRDKAKAS